MKVILDLHPSVLKWYSIEAPKQDLCRKKLMEYVINAYKDEKELKEYPLTPDQSFKKD